LAKEFKGSVKEIEVSSGKTTYCNFELVKKEPKVGDIIGKVVNAKTNEPVIARLSIPVLNRSIESDANGMFEIKDLAPSFYQVIVEADGYETGIYSAVVYAGDKTKIEVKMVKGGMLITFPGIKFDVNTATIKPESDAILHEAARILNLYPDIRVEIQGHTDSVGSDAFNFELSRARANAVRDHLIRYRNIDPSRLIARGYGELKPVASNLTENGRTQNRRVDFLIIK
jgi:outer membrane protein OmpA-like peptidoglycan-associated protein